jgi:hypothetical protein
LRRPSKPPARQSHRANDGAARRGHGRQHARFDDHLAPRQAQASFKNNNRHVGTLFPINRANLAKALPRRAATHDGRRKPCWIGNPRLVGENRFAPMPRQQKRDSVLNRSRVPIFGASVAFEPPLAAASRSAPFSTKHPFDFNTQHRGNWLGGDLKPSGQLIGALVLEGMERSFAARRALSLPGTCSCHSSRSGVEFF